MIVSLAAAGVVAVAVLLLLGRARASLPTVGRLDAGTGARRRRWWHRVGDAVLARLRRRPGGAADRRRTDEQEELARVLRLATRSAGDAHHLLRPVLGDIARGRLLAAGVDLDDEPDRARLLLGDDLADLLDPTRPLPADFFAAGIPLVEIEAHVARLEAL